MDKSKLDERRRALRKFRKQTGLSLQQVADLSGLSKSMMSSFETGRRDLSTEAFQRVAEVIADFLSDKKMQEKREAARKTARKLVPLRALLHAQPLVPEETSLEIAEQRIRELEELVETYRTIIEGKEEIIQEYQAVHADDERMIEGYRKLHETDRQIIALLQESGPASAAMQGAQMLEELEKLRAENAELRTWLNAEEMAAISHAKAVELRDRVSSVAKNDSEKGE